MQAWDGGRGRGEAVTDTPRADLLAGLRQCAPCTGWDLSRSGHPDRCGRSCAVLVSAPSNMVLPPAGSVHRMQRTTYNILDRQLGDRVVNLNESLG